MMSSSKSFIVTIVAVVAVTVDAASLRDVARDVRSDRVLLNAGLSVAEPQFRNKQQVDLSRLDVPTGCCPLLLFVLSKVFAYVFMSCAILYSVLVGICVYIL